MPGLHSIASEQQITLQVWDDANRLRRKCIYNSVKPRCYLTLLLFSNRPPSGSDPELNGRLPWLNFCRSPLPGPSRANGLDFFSFSLIFFRFFSIAFLTAPLPPVAARASYRARTRKSFLSAVPWRPIRLLTCT